MTGEPLVTASTLTAAVTAVLALVVAFGLDLTTDQTAAILGVTAVVGPLVVSLLARGKVTPYQPDSEAGDL